MSIYGGPDIVTDGLVLHLDAANNKSYPGSGSTWFDLSGNNNHATLTNGPVFSSVNGGIFNFDGIDDYAECPRPSQVVNGGQITIILTAKWTTKSWNNNFNTGLQTLIDNNHAGSPSPGVGFVVQDRPDLVNSPLTAGFRPASNGVRSTYMVGNNNWSHIAVTYNTNTYDLYLNNILNSTVNETGGLVSVQPLISIGRWQGGLSRYFDGSIGLILLYDRALSINEVDRSFAALKGRYGL